jgi:hypothetical protein
MLIRAGGDRYVPADGAAWRPSSGLLDLRLAESADLPVRAEPGHAESADLPVRAEPGHAEARVLLAVDLDDRSRVLDVDLIGLPAELLAPLGRYAVPPRPSAAAGPVALDLDAAWLWIHVQDGRRTSRHRVHAVVRFSFAGTGLVAVQARVERADDRTGARGTG